jgi:CHAT domain-containing protein
LKYLRRKDASRRRSLLAFGNPDINDAAYPPLPFAEREVESIAGYFSSSKIFTRRAATESRLLRLAADFDVIHLACHSDLNAAYPMFSKLLLAPDEEQDGELSVYEIFHLPIKADLVVLSACRTGMGKLTNGDEVVGLSRAFLASGASAVLVALWRVDDAATTELMTKFYGYLQQYPPTESLRRAQADCRRADAALRSWAPFILISSPDESPLNGHRDSLPK